MDLLEFICSWSFKRISSKRVSILLFYYTSSFQVLISDCLDYAYRFAIVFISNQAGLPHVQKAFVEKLALIGSDLNSHGVGVPFRAFGAFDYDQYRKPCVGTWEKFVREFNDGIPIG